MRRLEYERRIRGLTQKQLGQLSGVDASYISNAEKNGFIYKNHAQRICRTLGLDANEDQLLSEIVSSKEVI